MKDGNLTPNDRVDTDEGLLFNLLKVLLIPPLPTRLIDTKFPLNCGPTQLQKGPEHFLYFSN